MYKRSLLFNGIHKDEFIKISTMVTKRDNLQYLKSETTTETLRFHCELFPFCF